MPFANWKQLSRRSKLFFVSGPIGIFILIVILVSIVWSQKSAFRNEQKARNVTMDAGPAVKVIITGMAEQLRPIELIGEARPYASVTLYAKVSGYIQNIKVDKGDQVEAGQILAIIDSPELNRQYEAALADALNKRHDANRYQQLFKSGSISQQNVDSTETIAKIAEENAAVLRAQKEYTIVRAPFSGTIAARYVDPGALVQSATSSQTTALPVVSLSQTDKLRVYVYPDQKTAGHVRLGDTVQICDVSSPETMISAKVTRTSGELDPKTKTLLVEIELDNKEGKILAGSFVKAILMRKVKEAIEIPAQTLLIRKNKTYVAVLSSDNTIIFQEVEVYDSDGRNVRIVKGISAGDKIVLNPTESLANGEKVRPIVQR